MIYVIDTPDKKTSWLNRVAAMQVIKGEARNPSETIVGDAMVLYFLTTDLVAEVFKRTTYVAKSRKDKETQQNLLNAVAMTSDDKSILSPIMKEAATKAFDSLAPFCRQIPMAFLYEEASGIPSLFNRTYTLGDIGTIGKLIYQLTGAASETVLDIVEAFNSAPWTIRNPCYLTDDKIGFVINRNAWFNTNSATSLDTAVFETLVTYMMARWFTFVFPEEAAFYFSEYERNKAGITHSLNSQNRPLNRRHRMF